MLLACRAANLIRAPPLVCEPGTRGRRCSVSLASPRSEPRAVGGDRGERPETVTDRDIRTRVVAAGAGPE